MHRTKEDNCTTIQLYHNHYTFIYAIGLITFGINEPFPYAGAKVSARTAKYCVHANQCFLTTEKGFIESEKLGLQMRSSQKCRGGFQHTCK